MPSCCNDGGLPIKSSDVAGQLLPLGSIKVPIQEKMISRRRKGDPIDLCLISPQTVAEVSVWCWSLPLRCPHQWIHHNHHRRRWLFFTRDLLLLVSLDPLDLIIGVITTIRRGGILKSCLWVCKISKLKVN